jgi:hypothetical protein
MSRPDLWYARKEKTLMRQLIDEAMRYYNMPVRVLRSRDVPEGVAFIVSEIPTTRMDSIPSIVHHLKASISRDVQFELRNKRPTLIVLHKR